MDTVVDGMVDFSTLEFAERKWHIRIDCFAFSVCLVYVYETIRF